MNMSSVSATRPSVEFSSGTRPNWTWRRLTSSKTAAIEPTGTCSTAFAKFCDRGEVAVAVFGPQVGDPDGTLKRPRAAHQLAEDDPQRLLRQRPVLAART